jgi:hypothetical protein
MRNYNKSSCFTQPGVILKIRPRKTPLVNANLWDNQNNYVEKKIRTVEFYLSRYHTNIVFFVKDSWKVTVQLASVKGKGG